MTLEELTEHLTRRLREVQQRLGLDPIATRATVFADAVDSMGLVEFVGVIASDCGVGPEAIEKAVGRRFSTIADLARAMHVARIGPITGMRQETLGFALPVPPTEGNVCLAGWNVCIPDGRMPAVEIDRLLNRPAGWLTEHAGIAERWLWQREDSLDRVAAFARSYLSDSGGNLAALLVTGEVPWQPVGQAAALHARMKLPAHVPALEVGGACVGLLHCAWLARYLARPGAPVLTVAIEAPSAWLRIQPGPVGEAAALFGDGVGMCLLSADECGGLPIRDVVLGCDGTQADLVAVDLANSGNISIRMDGPTLALQAVRRLAEVVREICEKHGLKLEDLEGVYIHAGNGRMPALVARHLGLPEERVISTTAQSGNLGSVSLVAGLCHRPPARGPVVLAAVGAGLCWGAALLG